MNTAVATAKASEPPPLSSWLTAGRACGLVVGYFLVQALLRTLVSNSAELDESEQLMWTQSWAWGYGSDPPLYTWLQILFFKLFGTSIFGLALLKNLLLGSAFIFTFLSAREMTGDDRVSAIAMLSLLLYPQITWESQRDLTHSVLATALAAGTFWTAVRIVRRGRPIEYALLGVWLGLGTLSKYSYCLLALALAAAALTVPAFRRALVNKWVLLTVGTFLCITAWHFHWVLRRPDLAWSRPEELARNSAGPYLRARLFAVLSVLRCIFTLTIILIVVFAFAFRRRVPDGVLSPELPEANDGARIQQWIVRTLLAVIVISLGLAVATGIPLRERWYQPMMFLLPLSAAWLVRHRLAPESEPRFLSIAGAAGLTVLLLLPAIPLSASITHRPTRLNAPYVGLTRQLQPALQDTTVIVAANRLVGGNLRLRFPEHPVIAPEFQTRQVSTTVPWLVVWDATKTPAPSAELERLVAQLRGINISTLPPAYVEANCKYTRVKTMKLGYLIL